jgi:hypothetical protein
MATRIKASAVRRRIKRRSERASHKKKANATLRSRKQRARKTARVMRKVMRGGLFGEKFTIIYEAADYGIDHKFLPKSRNWKCLTLNFSKNLVQKRECYTLKLTFDLNDMLILPEKDIHERYKYLRVPLIINGLFNRIFGYEYDVTVQDNGYISVKDAQDSIQFNTYKITADLASPQNVDGLNGDNLKINKKFTTDCVIELEFCPSQDNKTTVELKEYTTFEEKVFAVKYWAWSTAKPKDKVITVNKKFDDVVANISELIKDKNKNLYLLLPSVLYSIHSTEPTYMYTSSMSNIDEQFYWFDKMKLDEYKEKALTKYNEIKAKKTAEEKEAKAARQAEYEKQRPEIENLLRRLEQSKPDPDQRPD